MKTFNYLLSFFKKRKKELPKQSLTIDNVAVPDGVLTQTDLILRRMSNEEILPLTDINTVLSDCFDVKSIVGNTHRFNKTLMNEAVFVLDSVKLVSDVDGKPKTMTLTLNEIVFNLKMEVTVDSSTFHEVFSPVQITQTT